MCHESTDRQEMSQKCLIWGTSAEVSRAGDHHAFRVTSHRAGGHYRITGSAVAFMDGLDEPAKAKLTTTLINRRRDEDVPNVNNCLLEESKKAPALTHEARAMRLLRYIADRESASPGQPVSLGIEDPAALAHSESWAVHQLQVLLKHLEGEELLEISAQTLSSAHCTVTVRGHNQLNTGQSRDTKQVFVAMWFGTEMRDAYEHGIAPGIRDAGFIPMRIDEKKDANRIDDDIIAEITKSRFVVADMTHGTEGVRGSVYFEAGFALGRELEVIYCCRRDCMELLPFDTRQYHHIVWKTPEELRRKLSERIRARIGGEWEQGLAQTSSGRREVE